VHRPARCWRKHLVAAMHSDRQRQCQHVAHSSGKVWAPKYKLSVQRVWLGFLYSCQPQASSASAHCCFAGASGTPLRIAKESQTGARQKPPTSCDISTASTQCASCCTPQRRCLCNTHPVIQHTTQAVPGPGPTLKNFAGLQSTLIVLGISLTLHTQPHKTQTP
jgi:hypothetical protein